MTAPTRKTTITVFDAKTALGREAARQGAGVISAALAARGRAAIVLATGASQFEFLDAFVREPLDWPNIAMFHLDEYVGLGPDHPASFQHYLIERATSKVPFGEVHFIDGLAGDPEAECRRLAQAIGVYTIDAAFAGIGENGHLAFNDPPADFDAPEPFAVATLDERCRRQQVGEGWFASLGEVPRQAITMTIPEILRARSVFVCCPDARKADAVKATLDGPIDPKTPASALRLHPDARFFLDSESASGIARG